MNARTTVAIALALLPVFMLLIYTVAIREMHIGSELLAVGTVRYLFAAGAALVFALPLHLFLRRGGAARGRTSLIAFLCLLNLFVLAHILATMTMT